MITSKDFVPEELQASGFLRPATYEQLSATRHKMSQWIESEGIEVVNIETVTLPNLHHPHEEGSEDASIHVNSDFVTSWNQFFRVWYVKYTETV